MAGIQQKRIRLFEKGISCYTNGFPKMIIYVGIH